MRRTLIHVVALAIMALVLPGGLRLSIVQADESDLRRSITVQFEYLPQHVYGGRLTNSKAAFTLLSKFFDSTTLIRGREFSFIDDVIGGMFRQRDGFVWTQYGYAYGTCGAASLLNELILKATFRDNDGQEKPLFEVLTFRPERNPTYGPYGAAIFIDLEDEKKSSDYRWRLNPLYDGESPRISITFVETGENAAKVSMRMQYSDEVAAGKATHWGG